MQANFSVCVLAAAVQLFSVVLAEAQTSNPSQPRTLEQRLIGKWQPKPINNPNPDDRFAHLICDVDVLEFGADGKLNILIYDFRDISKCPHEPGPCQALNPVRVSEHPGRYRILGKDSILLEIPESPTDSALRARRVYKMKWTDSSLLLRYDEKSDHGPTHTAVDYFHGKELYKYGGRDPDAPDCRP